MTRWAGLKHWGEIGGTLRFFLSNRWCVLSGGYWLLSLCWCCLVMASVASRAALDRMVVRDLMGFDQGTYMGVRSLAEKWCAEPSVQGGKKRPQSTKLAT